MNNKIHKKKSLGQVFLKNTEPIKIVPSLLKKWGVFDVMEIGPGSGILTFELLHQGINVIAVEKDSRFCSLLQEKNYAENLKIINDDILNINIEDWIRSLSGRPAAIVGNIPYNISTPILMFILSNISNLKGAILMLQLEFAKRLVAMPKTKAYGSLTIYSQLRSKINIECLVKKECFSPVPKVDSALISLLPFKKQLRDNELRKLEIISRMAFQQRRKKMKNSLKSFLDDNISCPIDLNKRPESLTIDEFITLSRWINEKRPL